MERGRRHVPRRWTRTPTFLTKSHGDWASLPFPVVHEIVRVLKSTRRWRLDGRSLRLLNRHWSQAISLNVREIRPNTWRTLMDADVFALLKFPCVTSVDMSPFLLDPPIFQVSAMAGEMLRFLSWWYTRQLERLMDVLCRLPRLSQIEIGRRTLLICWYECAGSSRQWSRLRGITSLYCYCVENLRLYGSDQFNTTWIHQSIGPGHAAKPIEEIVGCLRALKSVEIQADLLFPTTSLDFLEKVESVVLRGLGFSTWMKVPLQQFPSATSAALHAKILSSMVDLSVLRNLQDLEFMTDSGSRLVDCFVVNSMKQLRLLDLTFVWRLGIIPDRVFDIFEQLECLNLAECTFCGAALQGNMPHLKALRVVGATLRDSDASFLIQFHKLEFLTWAFVYSWKRELMKPPLNESALPNLRSLSTSLKIGDDSALESISKRTNLEVLSLSLVAESIFDTGSPTGVLSMLEKLQSLRILRIFAFSGEDNDFPERLLLLNMITKLEQLWLDVPENALRYCPLLLENIRKKAPHIIIETQEHKYSTWAKHFFDSAFFI